jgi:hypothetical protein
VKARLSLLGALALAACGPAAEPAPGVVESFTANIHSGEADARTGASEEADARAEGSAEGAKRRIARSERERRAGDGAAPEMPNER